MDKNCYIPALSFHWLTPLYDPILKWVMQEDVFKRRLVREANLQPGMRVLDLGCGTGTLTIMLKEAYPYSIVTGLDGDPQVLAIAREKAGRLNIRWEQGFAYDLPYSDAMFDCVVTSLVIHHLVTDDKRRAFLELFRVLRSGRELHVLDFGAPHSIFPRLISRYMRHLEEAADNFAGRIPLFITAAGFEDVMEVDRFVTAFGPLSLWRAVKGK